MAAQEDGEEGRYTISVEFGSEWSAIILIYHLQRDPILHCSLSKERPSRLDPKPLHLGGPSRKSPCVQAFTVPAFISRQKVCGPSRLVKQNCCRLGRLDSNIGFVLGGPIQAANVSYSPRRLPLCWLFLGENHLFDHRGDAPLPYQIDLILGKRTHVADPRYLGARHMNRRSFALEFPILNDIPPR